MNNYNPNPFQTNMAAGSTQSRKWDWRDVNAPSMAPGKAANAFISRVFTVMAFGLGITALVSWLFAATGWAIPVLTSPVRWLIIFAPFIFILVLNFGIHKLSTTTATILFMAFATVMGISLSSIFFVYNLGTIFQVFAMTAVTFGLMALLGATTNIDLTKFGTILMFALFGLVLTSIINWFMASTMLEFIISAVGVLIFAGLTAYDTQKMLRIGQTVEAGEAAGKMAIMGALALYLDFINLFLFMLRLFGGSRD